MARVKGTKSDMDGSFSVFSTPGGIPVMFSGKGREMTLISGVSERKSEMKGCFLLSKLCRGSQASIYRCNIHLFFSKGFHIYEL